MTLIVAYGLAIGGTYNGVLLDRLQIVSLALLTAGAAGWWWFARRGLAQPRTPLDPALIVWAAAYAVSALASDSTGRAAIGTWYAGLYAGVWFILSDLRRRGLPGRWITDAALFTSIPLILLALAQVGDWFPAWAAARQNGIAVPWVSAAPAKLVG